MRRARLLFTTTALTVILGCESPAPAPTEPATTSATSATGATPPGLAPLSTTAILDQPMQAPAQVATAEQPPEMVAVQHLVVAYKGASRAPKTITRSKADAKKRAEEALARVKKGDDFTELVKVYSDEPGAADRLGSTGKFKRGVMARAFDEAAFALKVGAVSEIVETEFGFHILKRNQ